MAKGNTCHRCGKTRKILLQTDYINTKIERPHFPKDKLICKRCVQKALGERRYFRLMDDFFGTAFR
ncbi:MAG: hypothetical protein ACFFCB_02275 [Candidatus Odinarchaeota archaeon]